MSGDNLENHYKTIFALVKYHGYSRTEILNMIPFELEMEVAMIMHDLEDIKRRREGITSSSPVNMPIYGQPTPSDLVYGGPSEKKEKHGKKSK